MKSPSYPAYFRESPKNLGDSLSPSYWKTQFPRDLGALLIGVILGIAFALAV